MSRRHIARFGRDARGVTAIEFAFVAPVMALLIMGLSDMAYQSYVQAILSGALQKAGRDATIQGATAKTGALDAAVMNVVRSINPKATYVPSRKSYAQFGKIAPEQFDDNNGNVVFDPASECFTDVNGNNQWDADPGLNGQGGASDVVVYQITVTYPRLFPLGGMLGLAPSQSVSARTILKNQPFAAQASYTDKRICP